MKQIRTSAPTRIDLAGGTLDIWPLYLFHEHAQTVNAAISLRAHAEIIERTDGKIRLESIDTSKTVEVGRWQQLEDNHGLPLLSRLARFFRAENLTLRTRGESPAGAGIAGSSALNVAVCAALAEWSGMKVDGEQLLTIAMNVEAQVINVPTGLQDYRPAYYGGVSAIELRADGVRRVAVDVDPAALQSRVVLAYTGAPHFSGTNNWEITKRHIDGDRHVFDCFERIADAAGGVRDALAAGDWNGLSTQINLEWDARKQACARRDDAVDRVADFERICRGSASGEGLRRRWRRVPLLCCRPWRCSGRTAGAASRRRPNPGLPDRD